MANTVQLNKKIIIKGLVIWEFLITLSANYLNSGGVIGTPGETINFNGASNPNFVARPKIPAGPPAGRLPLMQDIKVLNEIAGFSAIIEPNAVAPTPANYAMRIFGSGGNEMASGAYSAAQKAEPFVVHVYAPLKYN